jgi:hypothetical protein
MTTEEAGLFAILLQKALVHSRGRIRDAAGVLHQAMVSHEGGMPTWAFFAGLALGPDKVDVCTAGTLRVVLVEGGSVTQSTRDHILREDPQPGVEYPAEHETVVTRALGIGSMADANRCPASHSLGRMASSRAAGPSGKGNATFLSNPPRSYEL